MVKRTGPTNPHLQPLIPDLKKLYSKKAFSKGHLLYERLATSIPANLKGYVDNVLKNLIREELIIYYGKTKHGDAYQLNIKRLKEIEEIIT